MATVDLFKMIVENTKASSDSDHIHIVIDNNTQVPDRTNAVLFGGDSPIPEIVKSGKALESLGADILLIPCNTSHYYYDEITAQLSAYVVNMVEEAVKEVVRMHKSTIGLLATSGTIYGKVYEKYCDKYGINLVPLTEEQQSIVMDMIYLGVKAGDDHYNISQFQNVVDYLYENGAELIILGCTEILLGCQMYGVQLREFIEPMKVVSKQAILLAGYEMRN